MSTTLATQVPLTEAELKLLQTLVYQECGMYFDERRTHFLKDRLQRRLKACQMDSFYSYYRLLTSREGKQELVALLENLTVNETSFFRIRPQLDLFQKVTAGRNFAAQAGAPRLVIADLERGMLHRSGTLHAGDSDLRCAGLLLLAKSAAFRHAHAEAADSSALESGNPGVRHQLFGVAHGAAGNYTEAQMETVDYTCRLRYFEKVGDKYSVKPALKNLVQFDFHNLKTEYLPQRNDVDFLPQCDDLFRRGGTEAAD